MGDGSKLFMWSYKFYQIIEFSFSNFDLLIDRSKVWNNTNWGRVCWRQSLLRNTDGQIWEVISTSFLNVNLQGVNDLIFAMTLNIITAVLLSNQVVQ